MIKNANMQFKLYYLHWECQNRCRIWSNGPRGLVLFHHFPTSSEVQVHLGQLLNNSSKKKKKKSFLLFISIRSKSHFIIVGGAQAKRGEIEISPPNLPLLCHFQSLGPKGIVIGERSQFRSRSVEALECREHAAFTTAVLKLRSVPPRASTK